MSQQPSFDSSGDDEHVRRHQEKHPAMPAADVVA